MANQVTDSPWIIDTASGTPITTRYVVVRAVRWVGATAAGHTAVLQDQNGVVKWASEAAGASYVESDGAIAFGASGLTVPTLASGKLYLYFLDMSLPLVVTTHPRG